MSTWGNVPASLPNKQTPLPEANKLARMIRSGRTINDLAVRYGVSGVFIQQTLTSNGWDASTGQWTGGDPKDFRGAPLAVLGGGPGQSRHHVGGGDNLHGLPLTSRPFTERPKPKGFAWPTPPDTPFPTGAKSRRRPRVPTAAAREANTARRKLSTEDRKEVARRYIENLESSVALAEVYSVNQRTITKVLRAEGVTLRSRSEAGRLRWLSEHGGGAA